MTAQEPPARSRSGLPSRWVLTRDIGSWVLGWGLAVWEIVHRSDLRPEVLIFCAGVVGVPALVNGATSVADVVTGRSGTASQSPPSPPAAP